MPSESSYDLPALLDTYDALIFDTRFIDPTLPSGLWFCDCAETVQAIQINAVCLASSKTWDDLSRCKDFFQSFPYIVIVCPDPEKRQVMTNELRRRIPDMPFYMALDAAFRGCKTVPELRDTHGQSGIDRILLDSIELPAYGLLDISDLKPPDLSSMISVRSGFPPLDRKTRGFSMGELSVWTGRRGEGKSTLLSQLLIEAIDQGFRVCAYSGELAAWKFKLWASLQAAGPENIVMAKDALTGAPIPAVFDNIQAQIDNWWCRRFMLYDIGVSAVHDAQTILRLFNYAHNYYGCDVFLVDNIMTTRFKTSKEADFYRAQANFVAALISFARRAKVHIHLVAHPRKSQQGGGKKKHLDNDDVGGIGDITNLADNVFSLERSMRAKKEGGPVEPVTELTILKNRMWGDFFPPGQAMGLDFDKKSRRFFRSDAPVDKHYGWDFREQVSLEDLPPDTEIPFDKEGTK